MLSLGQSSHDHMATWLKYSANSALMNILSSRLNSLSLELTSPLGLTSWSSTLKPCSPGEEVKAEWLFFSPSAQALPIFLLSFAQTHLFFPVNRLPPLKTEVMCPSQLRNCPRTTKWVSLIELFCFFWSMLSCKPLFCYHNLRLQ